MKVPFFIGLRYSGAKKHNALLAFLSAISVAGLMLGVGLLIAVLSVMNGFDKELKEKILTLMPQGIIYQENGIEDWPVLQRRIEQQAGVVAAAPFVEVHALVSFQTQALPIVLYGLAPDAELKVSQLAHYLAPEVLKTLGENKQGLVLGKALVEKLGLKVGEPLLLVVPNLAQAKAPPKLAYFTLLASLDTHTELDQTLALTGLLDASALTANPQRVSGMRLKVDDLFQARTTVWQVVSALGQGFSGTSWMLTHGNLYAAIHMSKQLVGLLMSLIVAIAAFNVVSTLVMVVTEKQGDIAILRTLGLSTGGIMRVFMVQGLVIGLIGTFGGVLLGLVLSLLAQPLVAGLEALLGIHFLKSDVYPLTYIPSQILLWDIVWVAGVAFVMSFLATLYPSWRASRIQPAVALRYE